VYTAYSARQLPRRPAAFEEDRMIFHGFVYFHGREEWLQVCRGSRKSDVDRYVHLMLDEMKLPEDCGITLLAGRRPFHTPSTLPPRHLVNPTERGTDGRKGGRQK
jgi:hypothetical protein